MKHLADLIAHCKDATSGRFSDLFVREKDVLRIRTAAGVEAVNERLLERADIMQFLEQQRPDLNVEEELARRGGNYDFGLELDGDDYRANLAFYNGRRMLSLVLRKHDRAMRSLKELGLPNSLLRWVERDSGIVFLVGPTGSGGYPTLKLCRFVDG